MQIKETLEVSFHGAVESPPLVDVVVLADSAGVALGVQRTFSARVRSVRDDGSGLIASRCVEIPLLGPEGEVSGVLCHTAGAAREFVEIVVADDGEGMTEEVLSQAVFAASILFGRRRDCAALGSFAPGAYRRGAAERQHASIATSWRLCGLVKGGL